MQRDEVSYQGYGKCSECGEPVGRRREGDVTVDQCHCCGAEWACHDDDRAHEWQQRRAGSLRVRRPA